MANIPEGSRFQAWSGLFVFSIICLTAYESSIVGSKSSEMQWITAALSMSLIFSFVGVVVHFIASDKFVGQMSEGGLALLLLLIWVTSLPFIMDHSGKWTISNSNLYFFSWSSFATNVYILASFTRDVTGRHYEKEVSPKSVKWGGLFFTSIVLLASASQMYIDARCSATFAGTDFCGRTSYAIALGVFGMIFPLIAVAATSFGQMTVEAVVACLMFVMYIFGVGFITFGNGPGIATGNLYFSTWIGFALSMLLCTESFMQVKEDATNESSSGSAPAPQLSDIERNEIGVEVSLEK